VGMGGRVLVRRGESWIYITVLNVISKKPAFDIFFNLQHDFDTATVYFH
jgi:hypothetical protein